MAALILEEQFTICAECNCDMPNEDVCDGRCKWCRQKEEK